MEIGDLRDPIITRRLYEDLAPGTAGQADLQITAGKIVLRCKDGEMVEATAETVVALLQDPVAIKGTRAVETKDSSPHQVSSSSNLQTVSNLPKVISRTSPVFSRTPSSLARGSITYSPPTQTGETGK